MTLVGGRFELGRKIGAGGMGTVHEARDRQTDTQVALKLLRSRESVDVERFAREATVLAQLSHPGIVAYVAHGVAPDEDAWLAMEWLEGHTLAERLMRDALTIVETLALARQVAAALQAAHQRGIVHRDVKPANLFLVGGDASRTKVLDFGIARGLAGGHTLTGTGAAIGTPHYMSPEQARAERSLGPRTDVYALGVVLFEALTGKRPFEGDTPIAVLAKILLEEAPSLVVERPDVPAPLDGLLRAMLAKDPTERPADGAAVIEALDAIDVAGALPQTRTSLRPALGEREQRLVCVVMVADVGRHGASVPTVLSTGELATDLQGELLELARTHGGQAELLADGSMVVTVAGRTGVVTDQADRAARLALAIRDVLPDAHRGGRRPQRAHRARLPAGEVVDRGADALRQVPPAKDGRRPVRIDGRRRRLARRSLRARRGGGRALAGPGPARAAPHVAGRRRADRRSQTRASMRSALYEEVVDEPVACDVLVTARRRRQDAAASRAPARARAPTTDRAARARRRDARVPARHPRQRGTKRREFGRRRALDVRRRVLAARVGEVASGVDKARLTVFLGELLVSPSRARASRASTPPGATRSSWPTASAAAEDWLGGSNGICRRPAKLEDLKADQAFAVDACRHLEEPFFVAAIAAGWSSTSHPLRGAA
ncbi:MAG: serine/threonine-protein kinase [Polyangiales bacterium]